jgi:hypothetical protein
MVDLITDKKEIIERVREYLKENSFIELRDFCNKNCPPTHRHSAFVRDVAHLMRRSGDFEILLKNMNDDLTWEIHAWPVPHRSWTVRRPFWFAIVIAIMSTVFALLGNIWLSKKTDQQQSRRDSLQEKHLNSLSDSLTNYQNQLADSIATLRADTNLRNK